MCLLTNIHDPPTEGNYRDEHGNAIKPAIVADYNCHMGHVDNLDRLANSYTASRRTWKWTKKLFFHLLDLAIVNSYILYLHVVGRKFHTQIFVSPLSERCWHGLGKSHNNPCLWKDQLQLLQTSEDRTHVPISTGLAATPSSGAVACVQRGA